MGSKVSNLKPFLSDTMFELLKEKKNNGKTYRSVRQFCPRMAVYQSFILVFMVYGVKQ